ncbi:TlpA family protein disulfide reductase [Anaerobacillus alkaliphilus]|uniref:TlpA family protein disulfide reductase n=1 Tax=Anaerobacillus alkaliphilus TaxID=1548597 RepID=A0A4Q0VP35_9BACI|nr:TlpA disulfide reductase family protein [Anaerobacillus alkaliphilus]RXI98202.1 TlpA family protein disulfide reductase [Anaerobacillus alkaliphilus]
MLRQRIISLVVLIVAIGFISYAVVTNQSPKVGAEKGMLAPDFTLPLWETGEQASLSSYRGEIVVLNLWASWCPPCRKEMPDLIRLHEDYKNQGVVVLGVNLATHERDENGVEEFMNEFKVNFPTFIDQPIDQVNRRGVVASSYNIQSIPYTYIIDSNGRIAHVIRGEVTYGMLETLIKEL